MAVAHGTDKALVLAHKAAIDAHLESIGMPVLYTNVFWGGRSEIKPSEISPGAYREWLAGQRMGADVAGGCHPDGCEATGGPAFDQSYFVVPIHPPALHHEHHVGAAP